MFAKPTLAMKALMNSKPTRIAELSQRELLLEVMDSQYWGLILFIVGPRIREILRHLERGLRSKGRPEANDYELLKAMGRLRRGAKKSVSVAAAARIVVSKLPCITYEGDRPTQVRLVDRVIDESSIVKSLTKKYEAREPAILRWLDDEAEGVRIGRSFQPEQLVAAIALVRNGQKIAPNSFRKGARDQSRIQARRAFSPEIGEALLTELRRGSPASLVPEAWRRRFEARQGKYALIAPTVSCH